MEKLQRTPAYKNKITLLIWLLCSLLFLVSCVNKTNHDTVKNTNTVEKEDSFKLWTWITANGERSDASFSQEFSKYNSNGIDAILVNTNADPILLQRLVPIAKENNLEIHAWMFTVNRPGDSIAEKHPEWYAVSRDGKSCFDNPPYVGYYKWLCPTREASKNHILSLVEELAKVDGITSVHLDYIRYSDVYLPISLLPKYGLIQDEELPSFDFCYCEVCVSTFETKHHKNPLDFKTPQIDMEWKNFRLNQIKNIVDAAYEIAHTHNIKLTAAVFPYPEMADHMVRQRWDKWNVDAVLPMIYNSFYKEEVDWIGFATKQGVKDLEGKNVQLHTGLYMPELSDKEVLEAINLAKTNGASGVSFFDGPAITKEQWVVIKGFKK